MDDEEAVRDVTGEILRRLGYEVEFAKDGDEAVDIYRKHRQSGRPFDAVIMDLTVPGGQGGKDAIRAMQSIDPAVKAIVSSGYSNDPVMADFRLHGFSGVVTKPCGIHEMSRVLHAVLTSSADQPAE
ncbi:MAG: response regulator receiver protein, partial [Nitrospirae bacterium GWC1_57_7]